MDQMRRRLMFVAGLAGIGATGPVVAQDSGSSTGSTGDTLPYCNTKRSQGNWTLTRFLYERNNLGTYDFSDSLSWRNPNSTQELFDKLTVKRRTTDGAVKGLSLAVTASEFRGLSRPISALQAGIVRVDINNTPLVPLEANSRFTPSEDLVGEDSYWQATNTVKFGAAEAARLWQAVERGATIKIATLVPSDAELGVSVTTQDFSFGGLSAVSATLDEMGAELIREAEAAQCRLSKISGGCYLTTVCCDMIGLPDDCFELRVLRRFRDGWLRHQPGGAVDIAEYQRVAPAIADGLAKAPDGRQHGRRLYLRYILPCLAMILTGQRQSAWRHYRRMVRSLT